MDIAVPIAAVRWVSDSEGERERRMSEMENVKLQVGAAALA